MLPPYFAYGSNLWELRLRARVPNVTLLGPAFLDGYELHWHKRSWGDGSAKCDVVPSAAPGARVHGALYAIPTGEKGGLDWAEGLGNGYDELTVSVTGPEGLVQATTYRAAGSHIDPALRPYGWYRDIVVAGAVSHGFPDTYVEAMRRVEAIQDPDVEREAMNRAVLGPCPVPDAAKGSGR